MHMIIRTVGGRYEWYYIYFIGDAPQLILDKLYTAYLHCQNKCLTSYL